ncbi:MAG: hypothetical protein PHY56_00820 [Candidatus Omnitrophica bacterium]|nr:hypothetical protein [Candidatus Omnitrophota bacterium]
MGDNGKIEGQEKNPDGKLQKTQEQLDKERSDRFAKDPYSFIEINELICGAIRNPKSQLGISILVGNCKRSELNNAQIELTHRMELARRSMDIEVEMRNPKIIPAKGGMINEARKIFGSK